MAIPPVDPSSHPNTDIRVPHAKTPAARSTPRVPSTAPSTASPASAPTNDVVALSPTQALLHKLRTMIARAPEIREDKVQRIRTAIDSGNYQVSSQDVARKIIDDAARNHIPRR